MERNHENENNTNDAKKGGAWERGGIHSLSDAKIQKREQRFKRTTSEEEKEKEKAEDKREAGGSSLLSYLGFNEKQTDDSVFQERLKPRYQAAGSRDSCGRPRKRQPLASDDLAMSPDLLQSLGMAVPEEEAKAAKPAKDEGFGQKLMRSLASVAQFVVVPYSRPRQGAR